MAAVTIRKLSKEVHRALKVRAALHGRSTEAEMRTILETAALPAARIKLGSLLVGLGRQADLTDADVESLLAVREAKRAKPRAM